MSVDTTAIKQSVLMDGVTLDFAFTFSALRAAPTDIKCKVINALGVETDLVYTTDYTVVVEFDGDGGVVTVVDPQSGTDTLFMYRNTTDTQESDYKDFNQFPADSVEHDFDRRTLKSQEQSDAISRSIKFSITSDISDIELPNPDIGKSLVWADTAGTLRNSTFDADSIATIALAAATASSISAAESAASAVSALASEYAAGTYATIAGSYATIAQEAAATIPLPTTGTIGQDIRVAADNKTYELYTPGTFATLTITTSATIALLNATVATIGTLFMTGDLTIFSPTPILVLQDSNSLGASSVGYIEWRDSAGVGRAGFLGNNTADDNGFLWKNEQGGNIGIQTTSSGTIELIGDTNVTGNLAMGGNSITGALNITATEDFTGANLELSGAFILANATASGVLTLGGVGGSNNENLTFDFESEADRVRIGSTTSAQVRLLNRAYSDDDKGWVFGNSIDSIIFWNTQGNDNLQIGTKVGGTDGSGYITLVEMADRGNPNRSPSDTSANPVLRIYSSDATQANDYIEMFHDQSQSNIVSGSGTLKTTSVNGLTINSTNPNLVVINLLGNGTERAQMRLKADKNEYLFTVQDSIGNSFIFTNHANRVKDHDHATTANPTLFINSDLNPDTSNNQWGSLHHDQENFIITSGVEVGDGSGDLPTRTIENAIVFAPRGVEVARVDSTKLDVTGDITNNGDTFWTGAGSGLPFGHIHGDHILFTHASMAINTWYTIVDADIISGALNLITHNGNGELAVEKAGVYLVLFTVAYEINAANKHMEFGISVDDAAPTDSAIHTTSKFANQEQANAGIVMLTLTAGQTVEVAVQTIDAGTPNIIVDNIHLTIVQMGG